MKNGKRAFPGATRGLVIGRKNIAASTQLKSLAAAGCDMSRVFDNVDDFLNDVRDDETLMLHRLVVMARSDRSAPRINLRYDASGRNIIETDPGRAPMCVQEMLLDAYEELAGNSGTKGSPGRPKKQRMNELEARAIWLDTHIATNVEAVAQMPGWSVTSAFNEFGGSGRKPGRKT